MNDPTFWSDSAVSLVDKAFIESLATGVPTLHALLLLIGLFDVSDISPTGSNRKPYKRYGVHWERLSQLLTDPESVVRSVYGWGGALDFGRFVDVTQSILESVRLPVRVEALNPVIASRYFSATNPAVAALKQLAIPIVSSGSAAPVAAGVDVSNSVGSSPATGMPCA